MHISEVSLENYRAYKSVGRVKLGQMQVIVGRNDAGKSSLLFAIDAFFNGRIPKPEDWSSGCGEDDPIRITVRLAGFADAIKESLSKMRLVSKEGELVLRKVFPPKKKVAEVSLLVHDYIEDDFQNLYSKNEPALNKLGAKYNLGFVRSGRSITNESKRDELAALAERRTVARDEVWVKPGGDALAYVEMVLPSFTLFRSNIELGTEQSGFQSPFQVLVQKIMERDTETQKIQEKIQSAVAEEVKKIENNLRDQTETITRLTPIASFQWNKLVTLDFETEDEHGTTVKLDYRGQGVQRLVVVAFFKYLAERPEEKSTEASGFHRDMIFAIEEPETYLHPSAQRELIESFRLLTRSGHQIIITSHSPVFAAEADPGSLLLVTRASGLAGVVQKPELTPEMVIAELGIMARDQLVGFDACVFVEGKGDQVFLESIAEKLKRAGKIPATFKDRNIGVVPVGGNNIQFYLEGQLIKKLNRNFAVLKDSDKKAAGATLAKQILEWKTACESMGGLFLVLDKRQIENYFHPSAIQRVTGKTVSVDDYNDVKELISTNFSWERHLKPIVEEMTSEEILDRDKYGSGVAEKHELVEKIATLLELVASSNGP